MNNDTPIDPNHLTHHGESSSWRWDLTAILLVFVVQIVYFTGIIASDDCGYLNVVWRLQGGESLSDCFSYFMLRFIYWGTIYLAVCALPHLTWACVLPSMLATLVILLIIRAFTCRHIDARFGAVAILIYGLTPINVAAASVALPEPVSTAIAWLGIYLASIPLIDREAKRAYLLCLVGGLLIGMGYSAKETVATLVPGFLLFVLVCRTRQAWAWRRATLVALGAGLWLAGEVLAALWVTGDPLARFHEIARAQEMYGVPAIEHTLTGLLSYGAEYLRWLANPRFEYGPIGFLMLAGLAMAMIKRCTVYNLLLCLIVPSLIYLSVGSPNLRHYQPVFHQSRYLIPLLPGLALLATGMVWLVWQQGPWLRRMVLVGGTCAALLSLTGPNQLAGRWYQSRTFIAGQEIFKKYLTTTDPDVRVIAACSTQGKFARMHQWLDCPKIEKIKPDLTSAEDWIKKYGGAYVLISRSDYLGPSRKKHAHRSLKGTPYDTLNSFECIDRIEPPRDRLSTIQARLLGQPVPTDPNWAVELWRIPAKIQQTS